MVNFDGNNTIFQVIISPICISRADGMNIFFIQKSISWINCSNEANNDNDHHHYHHFHYHNILLGGEITHDGS